jgi:hypothetical protein
LASLISEELRKAVFQQAVNARKAKRIEGRGWRREEEKL